MSTRAFRVTVTVEWQHTADVEIDWNEYLEWLGGDEDTEVSRREFLVAGDELEVVADVSSRSDGEVVDSRIEAVQP